MAEASEEQLMEAVRECLIRDGRLNKFKAELRGAVMTVLNKPIKNKKPPVAPEETRIINELIKEYLDWNGYRYSAEVLMSESGQDGKIKREVMASKLGLVDAFRLPLLYFLLADNQNKART